MSPGLMWRLAATFALLNNIFAYLMNARTLYGLEEEILGHLVVRLQKSILSKTLGCL